MFHLYLFFMRFLIIILTCVSTNSRLARCRIESEQSLIRNWIFLNFKLQKFVEFCWFVDEKKRENKNNLNINSGRWMREWAAWQNEWMEKIVDLIRRRDARRCSDARCFMHKREQTSVKCEWRLMMDGENTMASYFAPLSHFPSLTADWFTRSTWNNPYRDVEREIP